MSNTQQMTLFQHETSAGPARALAAFTGDNSLGEGIRSSYAILSIKGGRWHIKYKMNDKGKYVEGNSAPPDCYSLDGKLPSLSVKAPMHSNCTLCPMNQFGSLVGDNGVKQKACRDTKKLAVVPLADLRNEALGGPMLFRTPPSALGDLSKLADAMKARGFPYNAVAVRFSFDLNVSHPKPIFNAIRPLTDEEADIVAELYLSDGTAAVLADNDIVIDAAQAPVNQAGGFEQEPAVPVGPQPTAPMAPMAPAGQPAPVQAQASVAAPQAPGFVAAPKVGATPLVAAFAPPPPPPGMHGAVVQPFAPGLAQAPPPMTAFAPPPPAQPAHPAGNPFAAAAANLQTQAPVAPAAPKTRRKATPPVDLPAAAPTAVETISAPPQGQLDADIGSILKGLSAFGGDQ